MKVPSYERVGSRTNAVNLQVFGTNIASTAMFEGLHKAIGLVRRRIDDPSRMMNDIAWIILKGIEDNLATAGHGRWPDLAETTKDARAVRGTSLGAIFPDQPILNETGQMFKSISILRRTKRTIAIGPKGKRNVEILSKHEFGYDVIPQRPLLDLNEFILSDIYNYLDEALEVLLKADPHRSRVRKSISYKKFKTSKFKNAGRLGNFGGGLWLDL